MATTRDAAMCCWWNYWHFIIVIWMIIAAKPASSTQVQQYCSFFNNRAPTPQPGLKNCTWFKENSCCMQQEIEATFGRVKPLKGSSPQCQKYVNYLMCYICAPNQNIFYKREKLTVCSEYCDRMYQECKYAVLKGSVIKDLYPDGKQFCKSRRFEVETESCFTFDVSLDTSAGVKSSSNILILISMAFSCLMLNGIMNNIPLFLCTTSIRQKNEHQLEKPETNDEKNTAIEEARKNTELQKKTSGKTEKSKTVKRNTDAKNSCVMTPIKQVDGTWLRGFCKDTSRNMQCNNPTWLNELLIIFALCLCILPQGVSALTTDEVKMWARMLSADLTDLAKRGLKYDDIQHLYDNAHYATDHVNGTAKILEVKEKLATYFSKKKELAKQLAEWVGQIHDTWWQTTENRMGSENFEGFVQNHEHYVKQQDAGYVSDEAVRAQDSESYHGLDLAHDLSGKNQAEQDTVDKMEQTMPSLENLSLDVYKDADLPHRLPDRLLQYNKDFDGIIMDGYSVVKIPDDVDRHSQEVLDTVEWTSRLDEAFIRNREMDYSLRWQYFGSKVGVHRVFPGHEWPVNFIGFHQDYDPRLRPWYVAATSGPKDVVIILDASASMQNGGSWGRLKSVANNVLKTLTKYDFVNVVISQSSYWDKAGGHHEYQSKILRCSKHGLIPASPTHLKEFQAAIKDVQPAGGSHHIDAFKIAFELLKNSTSGDCQTLIIFVTDGETTDMDQRCSPGFYKLDNENKQHFIPGGVCDYDFSELIMTVGKLQLQLPSKAHLFTFLTKDTPAAQILPGELACNNHGAMATIAGDSDILHQMAPYFRYLEASSGAEDPIWTSPYRDQAGLGLIVTVAVPVYSNITKSNIGVVGIDTPLSHVEKIIHNALWGTTYAFMIDSRDGSTIIHPFAKPTAELLDDPVFVPILALETHNDQPADFSQVLEAMQQQETGDIKITENAWRAISVHNSLMWRRAEYSHYFFTDIPDSDYSIAFNLAKTDVTFQYAQDPAISGPISYLDDMEAYRTLGQNRFIEYYNALSPGNGYAAYPGLTISKTHSVVKLAPRCFCDPVAYLVDQQPNMVEIHDFINTFLPTYDIHCPRGTFKSDVRPDVKLTGQIESLWLDREATIQELAVWTYMGTVSGIMRILPGVTFNPAFDPTKREWYRQSEANRGKLVISSVYQDSTQEIGPIVTFSWAIHKAKPLTPPHCTGKFLDYGCMCDSHQQCKSEYCYRRSCADDLIQGIVAMDIRYHDLHRRFRELIQSSGVRKYCGLHYRCSNGQTCETKCYIVDDMTNLVVDQDFVDLPFTARDQYEGISLATKEGYVFNELLRHNIFIRETRIDYQATCFFSESIPKSPPLSRKWQGNSTVMAGPIPPFQNEYACIQRKVYYMTNKTLAQKDELFLVHGSLAHSPCSRGSYFFASIPDTNLYLLVIKDYQNLSHPLNLNCHLHNSVFAPGSYDPISATCSPAESVIVEHHPRTCVTPKRIAISCGYNSTASFVMPSSHMISLFSSLYLILLLYGAASLTLSHSSCFLVAFSLHQLCHICNLLNFS